MYYKVRYYPNRRDNDSGDAIDGIATPREIIFSVLIVGIMVFLGWLIHGKIESEITDYNTKIMQSIRFSDDEMFKHCLETSPGDAFCEGDLDAVSPVTDSEGYVKGEFWSIAREYQEYRKHTRIVNYTTGSGKNMQHHTRVETYWTWDTINTHREHCKAIRFCGVQLPCSKVSLNYWPDVHGPFDIGYHKRYVYHTVPKHHHGTIWTTFENRTIKDGSPFYRDQKPEQVAEDELTGSWPLWVFWIVVIILIGFAVFFFCMLNNRWLESFGKKKIGINIGGMLGY